MAEADFACLSPRRLILPPPGPKSSFLYNVTFRLNRARPTNGSDRGELCYASLSRSRVCLGTNPFV